MSLKKALLAATMLALPLAAQAQPVTGLYVGAGAGVNWVDTVKTSNIELSSDIGWVGVVSVGYGFGNGFRVEVEGNFRQNDADRLQSTTQGRFSTSGRIESYGAMVNALYEFALGPVQPYIGIGAGYIIRDVNVTGRTATASATISDSSGAFGYQGIVGLAIPIAAVPGLAITTEFRYLGSTGQNVSGTQTVRGANNSVTFTRSSSSEQSSNYSILAGLRYNFGQVRAAPIVPPAAPAATARTYIVFFDWNRADLTERARQIIAEAAAAAPRVQSTRIEVAGHTDTSGSAAYNQGLSQRRANTVAAELVARGVARNTIAISAFGETRLLVPTGDNVREPQNRRVEIVLR